MLDFIRFTLIFIQQWRFQKQLGEKTTSYYFGWCSVHEWHQTVANNGHQWKMACSAVAKMAKLISRKSKTDISRSNNVLSDLRILCSWDMHFMRPLFPTLFNIYFEWNAFGRVAIMNRMIDHASLTSISVITQHHDERAWIVNNICTRVTNCFSARVSVIYLCFFLELRSNEGNKHKK